MRAELSVLEMIRLVSRVFDTSSLKIAASDDQFINRFAALWSRCCKARKLLSQLYFLLRLFLGSHWKTGSHRLYESSGSAPSGPNPPRVVSTFPTYGWFRRGTPRRPTRARSTSALTGAH